MADENLIRFVFSRLSEGGRDLAALDRDLEKLTEEQRGDFFNRMGQEFHYTAAPTESKPMPTATLETPGVRSVLGRFAFLEPRERPSGFEQAAGPRMTPKELLKEIGGEIYGAHEVLSPAMIPGTVEYLGRAGTSALRGEPAPFQRAAKETLLPTSFRDISSALRGLGGKIVQPERPLAEHLREAEETEALFQEELPEGSQERGALAVGIPALGLMGARTAAYGLRRLGRMREAYKTAQELLRLEKAALKGKRITEKVAPELLPEVERAAIRAQAVPASEIRATLRHMPGAPPQPISTIAKHENIQRKLDRITTDWQRKLDRITTDWQRKLDRITTEKGKRITEKVAPELLPEVERAAIRAQAVPASEIRATLRHMPGAPPQPISTIAKHENIQRKLVSTIAKHENIQRKLDRITTEKGKRITEKVAPELLPEVERAAIRAQAVPASEIRATLRHMLGAPPQPISTIAKHKNIQRKLDRITTDWFDDLDPILQVQRKLGVQPKYTKDPYVRFRLLRGIAGRIIADVETQLHPVIGQIDDLGEFQRYWTAKRALQKTEYLGRQVVRESPDELRNIISATETQERQRALQKIVAFENEGLDALTKSGLITAKQAKQIKTADPFYGPWSYNIPESVAFLGKAEGVGGMPLKMKGSARSVAEVEDILPNVVKQYTARIRMAATNDANRTFIEWAKSAPGSESYVQPVKRPIRPIQVSGKEALKGLQVDDLVEEVDPEAVFRIWRPLPKGKEPGVLRLYENGKPEDWQFTKAGKDLYEATEAFRPNERHIVVQMLSGTSRLLRLGATSINPDFMARNLIRDVGSRLIQTESKISAHVIPDTARALFDVLGKSEVYREWQRAGGSFGGMLGYDANTVKRTILGLQNRTLRKRMINAFAHPVDSIRRLNEIIEEAPRLAEFKRLRKILGEGEESVLRAAMASRDVSLDFARAGRLGREWNEITAFFNAGMQDISKVKRTFQVAPVRTAARLTAWLAPPTLLEAWMNENNKYYNQLPTWQRAMLWNFPVNETSDDFISIPKPFLWGGLFANGLSEALQYFRKNDPEAFGRWIAGIGKTGLPSAAVTALTPIMAWFTNRNFFTEKDIESPAQKAEEPWLRYSRSTTGVAKAFGRMGQRAAEAVPEQVMGWDLGALQDALKISPLRFDALMQMTLGGSYRVGADIVELTGRGGAKLGMLPKGYFAPGTEEKERKEIEHLPIIRSILRARQGWIDSTELSHFRRNLERTSEARRAYERTEKLGIPMRETRRREILAGFAKDYGRVSRDLSRAWEDLNSAQTDDEKREIASGINEMVKEINRELKKELLHISKGE